MKNKVLVFVDLVAAKNKLQLDVVQEMGMEMTWFVNVYKPGSDKYFNGGGQVKLEGGFRGRFRQVYAFLKQNKKTIHHLEIYPGGRFSFIYLFLGKWFGIRTICSERGDLLYYNTAGYDKLVRFSMYCCYKFADIVWYREPYMIETLKTIRSKGLFFLHNAIHIHPHNIDIKNKSIDFLWLNRVIPERKSKWFLSVLKTLPFTKTNNLLVGMQEDTAWNEEGDFVRGNCPVNLSLAPYSPDPIQYFKQAKFFVLPADVVFANHALLEAMSYGLVPLISDTPGSALIVDDHVNGFLFEHTEAGFQQAMEEAVNMDEKTYLQYAQASREKVMREFSVDKYRDRLAELYKLAS
ncbi:MAG: hypothetical protein JWQ27_2523 [Ferruginibacter sp.]|nr:hypothetical protein [Ferruginibacter sp.]